VADSSKEAVIVFSSAGEYRYRITGPEGFIPSGVVVAEDGIPIIFNEADLKLYAYSPETKELQSVFGETEKKSPSMLLGNMFWDPGSEKIFAIDRKMKQVAVIKKGMVVDSWGWDYLDIPGGIAYDRSNNLVFVSDTARSRIVVFSSDGSYVGEFGSGGEGKESFNSPGGLAMDQRGRLYVADRGNDRVVIYSSKGLSEQQ
jgi:DNA-binding beta-propeller fold protein YncE